MKVWIGLSYGIQQIEYYFKNGKLFFIYEKEEDFLYNDKKAEFDYTKVKLAFEARYYLNRDKIIYIKKKGEKRFNADDTTSLKDFITESKSYEKLLRAHSKEAR